MSEKVLRVEDVSMRFNLSKEKHDSLKEYFIALMKKELKFNEFWALTDVSFELEKGDRLGILGFNGAGKSTLLKVIAGVFKPTKGSVGRKGVLAPLIELGAGFDPQYTGMENIYLYGACLGYSHKFIDEKIDEIIDFSELREFIDVPLKNYSSGMIAKLGFAVATLVEPEILILDEILSVGDVRFQKKSGDKLKSMMNTGTTVLLVSHSVETIRAMCNRVIWLDHGKIVMDGLTRDVCDAYVEAAKKASDEEIANLEI
jgi:ABC-type polysaccharide/polyol phosphate transport system ATPase subunit